MKIQKVIMIIMIIYEIKDIYKIEIYIRDIINLYI